MKHFFSFILISLVLLNEAHILIVYVSFKMHQDYIVNNLCVMKEAEENTCQGSCQLKRKLDFDDSSETSDKEKAMIELVKRYNFYRCATPEKETERSLPDIDRNQRRFFNIARYDDAFVHAIFHPPRNKPV